MFPMFKDCLSSSPARRMLAAGTGIMIAAAGLPLLASQQVALTWQPSDSPTVVGYHIYYGPAPVTYTNMISTGNVTNVTLSGLVEGGQYYLAVTAVDILGTESLPSNEATYTVPDAAVLAITFQPNSVGGDVTITASGAVPSRWALEASEDLKEWTVWVRGTNAPVDVAIGVGGAPARFFRLKAE